MKDKVGRNEPCPCGSEKKFKKCCLDAKFHGPIQQKESDGRGRTRARQTMAAMLGIVASLEINK